MSTLLVLLASLQAVPNTDAAPAAPPGEARAAFIPSDFPPAGRRACRRDPRTGEWRAVKWGRVCLKRSDWARLSRQARRQWGIGGIGL